MWFLPESPRWLIEHNKEAAGRAVLTHLHLNSNASNQEMVDQELSQIHESVMYEKRLAVRSWRQLLFSHQWRYRILLACGLQAMTQCSGVNVIQNYGPRLYKTLGFSTSTSLMIIGISGALAQLWNTIFMAFIDKVGRRKLLIPSLLGMGAAMCVEATLARYVDFGDANSNQDALRAAIAMFFVFSVFFTALGMISWIYQSEIFPTAIRARGSSIATATNWSLNLVFAQCSPIALTSMGSKYFYVFVAFNWAAVVIVWYWYPETVGKTLEEVEQVFLDPSQVQEPTDSPSSTTANLPKSDRDWTPPQSHHEAVHPLAMHPVKSDRWGRGSRPSAEIWDHKTGEIA